MPDFAADRPAVAQRGLGVLQGCLVARITKVHSVVRQAQQAGMKSCQQGINWQQTLEKKS